MGQGCGPCNSYEQQHPTDVIASKSKKRHKLMDTSAYPTNTMDYSSSDPDIPALSTSHLNVDEDSDTPVPDTPQTANNKESTIQGFKEAVLNGNDSLVMFYVDEYPDLDLLNLEFVNGDNCLHVAARNSSYKLIYWLLSNDISVKQYNFVSNTSKLHI